MSQKRFDETLGKMNPTEMFTLAASENLSPEDALIIAESEESIMQMIMLEKNAVITKELLVILGETGDDAVKRMVARHPLTPLDLAMYLTVTIPDPEPYTKNDD